MAISAPNSASNSDRELAPKGRFQAVLIGIKDEGMHPAFDKTKPDEPQLSFIFEISEMNTKGEPHSFYFWKKNSKWFDAKKGKMSGLVEMLTQWLDVSAEQIPVNLFDDLELLCGLNARVRLARVPKQNGGEKISMVSIEPWEKGDGALLTPTREWGDSGFFAAKTTEDFWKQVKSGAPSSQKPIGGDIAPLPGEENISTARIGEIRSEARAKLANDTSALNDFCEEGFGKKLIDLTKNESTQVLNKLRSLPDPNGDDDSIFGDDEADTETARTMLQPVESVAPTSRAKGNGKAQAEAYATTN